MGGVILLADNLFSGGIGGQYPAHIISAEEEPAGTEAWRVGNARRSPIDKATASTANSTWWIRSVLDRVRAHNCIVLDRGHNLAGKTFELRSTNDATDFSATFETVFDVTMPSVTMPGPIDNGLGVRTEEGAWIKRYPLRTGKAVELFIDAMGANVKPEIVNLWVGLAIDAGQPYLPHDQDSHELLSVSVETESGWIGRARRTRRRRGVITIKLTSYAAYEEQIRYHVMGLFGDGVPMWIVPDGDQAERAFLAVRDGVVSAPLGVGGYGYATVTIPFVEFSPKPF